MIPNRITSAHAAEVLQHLRARETDPDQIAAATGLTTEQVRAIIRVRSATWTVDATDLAAGAEAELNRLRTLATLAITGD